MSVQFFTATVLRQSQAWADEMVTRAAFQVEGQAKINVQVNGQIDTGFMLNSIYPVAPGKSTYDAVRPTGDYKSAKTGATERREIGDAMDNPPHRALVVCGAEYGAIQEMRNSFLYRALNMVEGLIHE